MTQPSVALVQTSDAHDMRLPAPIDKAALRSYLTLLEDPEALALQNRLAAAYDAACRALIGENDVQKEGNREFKKKSAWKKLARYFSISTVVISRDERFINDAATGESVFVASCTVRGTAPWGQSSDSVGACATDEETGKRKITIADAISTAETRASNRATSNLIAMGEVSAEEAGREAREQVVRQSFDEMTLDEAKAVKFPWRQPEKYRDKPLGELSAKMLRNVLDGVNTEIERQGEGPRRLELKRACELLIADKPAPEPSAAAVPAEPVAEPASNGGSVTMPAPGPVADALKPNPPTLDDLAASVRKLIDHEKVSKPEKADFRKMLAQAKDEEALRYLIGELENLIMAPV